MKSCASVIASLANAVIDCAGVNDGANRVSRSQHDRARKRVGATPDNTARDGARVDERIDPA